MRTRLVAVSFAAASAVLTACGTSNTASMDEGLKRDLAAVGGSSVELAPKPSNQQVVVSAIEGGPQSAPMRASTKKATAPKPVTKRTQRPVQSVAQAPAPAPTPVVVAPAPVEASPVEPAPLPPIQAPVARQPTKRQAGPYKTEAEIFREMPWIRP